MQVKQIAPLVNSITQEMTGEIPLLNEDLGNVVDVGTAIFGLDYDRFTRDLVDHIGRMIFVNRVYDKGMLPLLRDGWEYGSVLQKVHYVKLPEASENETWELNNGQSYDPNIFYGSDVASKFFTKRVTFEVDISLVEEQVKSAFDNSGQLAAFIAMIETAVDNSITIKLRGLEMRTINNMIAETLHNDIPGAGYNNYTGNRVVNLLKLYNTAFTKSLTADAALYDGDFLRFAASVIRKIPRRLSELSTLYNVGGAERFTPPDRLDIIMLNDFKENLGVYLYDANGQFLTDNLRLPNSYSVSYWQGPGTSYDFDDISSIKVTTASGHEVTASGIVGIMYDHDAVGISNLKRKTTSNYNPKADFTNYFHKAFAGYWNDLNENLVIFMVA